MKHTHEKFWEEKEDNYEEKNCEAENYEEEDCEKVSHRAHITSNRANEIQSPFHLVNFEGGGGEIISWVIHPWLTSKLIKGKSRQIKRRRIKRQSGGLVTLVAVIPISALITTGSRAIAAGVLTGVAGYIAKKALEAATRKRRRR